MREIPRANCQARRSAYLPATMVVLYKMFRVCPSSKKICLCHVATAPTFWSSGEPLATWHFFLACAFCLEYQFMWDSFVCRTPSWEKFGAKSTNRCSRYLFAVYMFATRGHREGKKWVVCVECFPYFQIARPHVLHMILHVCVSLDHRSGLNDICFVKWAQNRVVARSKYRCRRVEFPMCEQHNRQAEADSRKCIHVV